MLRFSLATRNPLVQRLDRGVRGDLCTECVSAELSHSQQAASTEDCRHKAQERDERQRRSPRRGQLQRDRCQRQGEHRDLGALQLLAAGIPQMRQLMRKNSNELFGCGFVDFSPVDK